MGLGLGLARAESVGGGLSPSTSLIWWSRRSAILLRTARAGDSFALTIDGHELRARAWRPKPVDDQVLPGGRAHQSEEPEGGPGDRVRWRPGASSDGGHDGAERVFGHQSRHSTACRPAPTADERRDRGRSRPTTAQDRSAADHDPRVARPRRDLDHEPGVERRAGPADPRPRAPSRTSGPVDADPTITKYYLVSTADGSKQDLKGSQNVPLLEPGRDVHRAGDDDDPAGDRARPVQAAGVRRQREDRSPEVDEENNCLTSTGNIQVTADAGPGGDVRDRARRPAQDGRAGDDLAASPWW